MLSSCHSTHFCFSHWWSCVIEAGSFQLLGNNQNKNVILIFLIYVRLNGSCFKSNNWASFGEEVFSKSKMANSESWDSNLVTSLNFAFKASIYKQKWVGEGGKKEKDVRTKVKGPLNTHFTNDPTLSMATTFLWMIWSHIFFWMIYCRKHHSSYDTNCTLEW